MPPSDAVTEEAGEEGAEAPAQGPLRAAPFQWNLLAWAALVGVLSGAAVVGFHVLLGFTNRFLFGGLVEGVMGLVGTLAAKPAPLEVFSPDPEASTPLQALLQIGLGGIGFLPPPPAPLAEPAVPQALNWLSLWPVLVAPMLGGVLVGGLRQRAKDLGPGLPSLMAMADGLVPAAPKLPFLRLVTAALSLGSGASLGPEGPSVEGGGNIGLWVGVRAALSPQSQKALVAAGLAAGLAAGFRAPIAGVFFAFEGVSGAIPGRASLRAVLVAAVSSSLITQLCLGDEPIFRLPAYEVRSLLELPLYLGLGVLASLMSWALVSLLAAGRSGPVQRQLERLDPWLLNALGGLGVGVMALGFPQVLGVGYDTIEALLGTQSGLALSSLLALLVVKLLATGLSNATGFVGGGFAPSLFLGAVLGNCYGQWLGESGLHWAVAEPPAYAMVGMAAVLAGSARAPLTALLLLFELTHDIRIVLPLMAATGLSALLMERWLGLADPGLLGPDPQEEQRRRGLSALAISAALEPDLPLVLPAALTPQLALARLIEQRGHCLLIEQEGWVVGLLTLTDLQRAITAQALALRTAAGTEAEELELNLIGCRRSELIWLPSTANLSELEDQLSPNGLRQLPVFEWQEGINGRFGAKLPDGLPAGGLRVQDLLGLACRDSLARALARQAVLDQAMTA
ncbi:MAG: chloride channel protein [Synechococcaceae cyanobacterium MAG-AL1]|nr:chloride channel protein [Candidatus Regnicoccus frigidus MAG-AL1]